MQLKDVVSWYGEQTSKEINSFTKVLLEGGNLSDIFFGLIFEKNIWHFIAFH